MLVLGGGGGGCASPKTLIFCPEFLLQSIFSLKMTTTKNPQEHHHFTVFAALKTIIFKIYVPVSPSIATHGPRPIYWGSWKQNVSSALRVYSWPACQPYASYKSAPERQRPPISCLSLLRSSNLHAWACCGALQFHARLAPKPPFFTLLWHRPTTIWAKVPPPPPWC